MSLVESTAYSFQRFHGIQRLTRLLLLEIFGIVSWSMLLLLCVLSLYHHHQLSFFKHGRCTKHSHIYSFPFYLSLFSSRDRCVCVCVCIVQNQNKINFNAYAMWVDRLCGRQICRMKIEKVCIFQLHWVNKSMDFGKHLDKFGGHQNDHIFLENCIKSNAMQWNAVSWNRFIQRNIVCIFSPS